MEPSFNELLRLPLQWLFVGGKGGVGKTTTSCAVATLFASHWMHDHEAGIQPRKVLLVSTDPAHNLSDAFSQQIGKTPTPICGLENTLYAMEVDRTQLLSNQNSFATDSVRTTQSEDESRNKSILSVIATIVKDAACHIPGIDELAVFTEILHASQAANFDLVVFDTAPTGHTLQLLAMPRALDAFMDKLLKLDGLMPLLESATHALQSMQLVNSTTDPASSAASPQALREFVTLWHERVRVVQQRFVDHTKTAFVCVCIPEFLSLYETERLIQDLVKHNIYCDTIVVNQVLFRPAGEAPCRMCTARQRLQEKYLQQIDALYDDFHVVKMPLLTNEVRGLAALQTFGKFLLTPYNVDEHGYVDVATPC